MSNAIALPSLKPIQYLFQQKQQEFLHRIGNLQISEVKEDAAFERTSSKIKNEILLLPVEFADPKIGSHRQIQRNMPSNFNYLMPHTALTQLVEVTYAFTGSADLFAYSPSSLSFSSSSTRVYQPGYGNQISIEVEVPALEKNMVLQRAHTMMETTFSLINQINPEAKTWSEGMFTKIERDLNEKRQQLLDFYNG